MSNGPQLVRLDAQEIAVIPVVVPRSQIQQVMGPGLMELMQAVRDQGVQITGPWFTHHLRITPEAFDFEIGVPVSAPVSARGRMRPSTWPAMAVVRSIHRGSFEGLGAAWAAQNEWIATSGLVRADDLWERYLSGPEESPNPEDWATELNRPVSDLSASAD